MSNVLDKRQKRLIGLAIVMKIKHFKDPKVAIQFDSDLVEGVIKEYEDILEMIGFNEYKKQR